MSDAIDPDRIVNRVQLASRLNKSLPTVDAWVRRGCPFVVRGGKGREWQFDMAQVVQWLIEDAVEQAIGGTATADINEARRRKVAAEAALAELDLAERMGTIAKIEEVTSVVVACFTVVRSRNLALPSRLAAIVPPEVRRAVFDVSTAEVHRMLTEMSETRLRGTALSPEAAEGEAA